MTVSFVVLRMRMRPVGVSGNRRENGAIKNAGQQIPPMKKISRAGANTTTTFVSPPVTGCEYFCVTPLYNFTKNHIYWIRTQR